MRGRHILLGIVASMSLLLCLGSVVQWFRLNHVIEAKYLTVPTAIGWRGASVSLVSSGVVLSVVNHINVSHAAVDLSGSGFAYSDVSGSGQLWTWGLSSLSQIVQSGHQSFGFGVIARDGMPVGSDTEDVVAVMAPAWFTAALFALLPLTVVVSSHRKLRARRAPESGCPRCGYDLTANISGVCPECGTAVALLQGPTL